MAMKPTTEAPIPDFYIGTKTVSLVGSELEIEAVENGYKVRTIEYIRDSDGDSIRKFRSYVFNEADDLLSAIRFWTKKQEIGK